MHYLKLIKDYNRPSTDIYRSFESVVPLSIDAVSVPQLTRLCSLDHDVKWDVDCLKK